LLVRFERLDGLRSLTPGAIFNYGWGIFLGCANPNAAAVPGQWSMAVYDNGELAVQQNPDGTITTWQPVPFTVSHGGQVGITSPTDNELFQLLDGNYNATGSVQFSAATNTGNAINWNVSLHYQSEPAGDPIPATDPTPLSFQGTSNNYAGYQSIGGQVNATAQTTASDGSTVRDCVRF
jgi:hypothetical protein